jgi:HD-GYP domain-containing protein (c-di-GMP phosphodiesterase class II)
MEAIRQGNKTSLALLTAGLGLVLTSGLAASYFLPSEAATTSRFFLGLLAFLVLSVAAEKYRLPVKLGTAQLGWSGTTFWALIVLFPTFWATVCAITAILISEILVHSKGIARSLFNAAQVGLSTLAGSLVFLAMAGTLGLSSSGRFFLAFATAVLVYWLVNTWLVSFGSMVLYGESPSRFWQRNYQWAFLYEFTSAPLALAVVYAYQGLWVTGLVLLTLPIVMVRQAYSQYLDLKKTYNETVRTMVKIIEMHDPYTAGHSDRVANYARRLCVALNVSPAKTERIELAAYLHDLGKINLDLTGVVRKAGKLTEEERRLIRMHPVMSADLANQVSYFKGEIEEMIRHHHENWDGSGYPHGLRGEEIPFGARIILLADAFDAMTTSRVYREALDIEFVKEEFRKFAGIQFDPELVPVFLDKVVKDGSEIISKPIDEPLEGQRARAPEVVAHQPEIRSIPRSSGL